MGKPNVLDRPEVEQISHTGGWIVKVYNNDYNSYDEVISILLAATGCSIDEAVMETWEIDHLGSSVVHYSNKEECERVASIIARIGIKVEVYEE